MDDYYVQESEKWKRQLEEMEKQVRIEKMSQLREKTYNLKESREKKRLQFVEECYDRQKREACDTNNDDTISSCRNGRKYLVEHTASRKENNTHNKRFLAVDDKEVVTNMNYALEMKELTEKEAQKKKQEQLKLALDEQVKSIQQKMKIEKEQRRTEERFQLNRWKEEEIRLKQKEQQDIYLAHERGRQMLEANELRTDLRQNQRAVERMEDRIMLQHALAMEQNKK